MLHKNFVRRKTIDYHLQDEADELNLSKPRLYADTLNMRNYMYVIALISLRLRSITRYSKLLQPYAQNALFIIIIFAVGL